MLVRTDNVMAKAFINEGGTQLSALSIETASLFALVETNLHLIKTAFRGPGQCRDRLTEQEAAHRDGVAVEPTCFPVCDLEIWHPSSGPDCVSRKHAVAQVLHKRAAGWHRGSGCIAKQLAVRPVLRLPPQWCYSNRSCKE